MIRIYGIKERLNPIKAELSEVINSCLVDALQFPANKRAQRFFPLSRDDLYYPEGRSDAYTVIEINMMEGRSVAARKKLIISSLNASKPRWASDLWMWRSRSRRALPVTGDFVA